MSDKLIKILLIGFCCIVAIGCISFYSYYAYLYYYDYDAYIAWLDTVRPFRWRWADGTADPILCLVIAIIIVIIKEKDKKKYDER